MLQEKILIVDDDIQVLNGYERVLKNEGYRVSTAKSGKEALEIFRKQKFNLVLTDMVMEEINGLQILTEIKKLSPDCSVILISGYRTLETTVEALRKDAVDFMMKPCNEDELKYRIRKALEQQKLGIKAKESEFYQKMSETLGAVAHEINNPLTAIIGNSELLMNGVSYDDPRYIYLKGIMDSSDRIAHIIRKMQEIRGLETKKYTNDSEVIDLQKCSEFEIPEKKTVLIVDDEEVILNICASYLTKWDYKVDTALNGNIALEMIKRKNYEIVVLDVAMPGIDGHETLQRMNEYYTGKKIRIPATIMITGWDVNDILEKCKEQGAFTALHKPFKLMELVEIISKAEEFLEQ